MNPAPMIVDLSEVPPRLANFPALRMLRAVQAAGSTPVSSAWKAGGLNNAATGTSAADRLEKAGLVSRRWCAKDRRKVYLDRTNEGRALASKIFQEPK